MTIERALEAATNEIAPLCWGGPPPAVMGRAIAAFLRALASDPPAEMVEAGRARLLLSDDMAKAVSESVIRASITRLADMVSSHAE